MALSVPVLRCALLSYSSNVLSLRDEISAYATQCHLSEVISLLIECLCSHPDPQNDEALLATAVILRMSEQFCEINEDAQRHLAGASSLFSLRAAQVKWSPHHTDLSGTSFWIYVREGLRLCFLNEERYPFDLGLIEEETSYGEADEEVWTNRMTYLLAKSCNLCFEEQSSRTGQEQNMQLERLLDMWMKSLPDTFRPWRCERGQFASYPEISFLSTWHGASPCACGIA